MSKLSALFSGSFGFIWLSPCVALAGHFHTTELMFEPPYLGWGLTCGLLSLRGREPSARRLAFRIEFGLLCARMNWTRASSPATWSSDITPFLLIGENWRILSPCVSVKPCLPFFLIRILRLKCLDSHKEENEPIPFQFSLGILLKLHPSEHHSFFISRIIFKSQPSPLLYQAFASLSAPKAKVAAEEILEWFWCP